MRSVALLFCLTIPLLAQQGPVNLNFQESGPGGEPTGWVWVTDSSHSIATVEDCRLPDSRCLMIRRQGNRLSGEAVTIMQSFDATALRGRQIRYRAFLRLEGALSHAHLFLRVDRPSGVGFSAYPLDRPIESSDWTAREIVGTIDADAVRVTIGLRYAGVGSAYFADPEIEPVGNQL
jgi:hypothetical protein